MTETRRMRRASVLLGLFVVACSSSDQDQPTSTGFDHTAVFEVFERDVQLGDATYLADTVLLLRTEDQLPSLEVTSLVAVGGSDVLAGTTGGLMRLTDGRETFEAVAAMTDPVVDVAAMSGGLLVAAADAVVVLDDMDELVARHPVSTATVSAVAFSVGHGLIFVGTHDGLRIMDNQGTVTASAAFGAEIRDILVSGDVVFMATGQGVLRYQVSQSSLLPAWTAPDSLPDDDVRALAVETGFIWAGTRYGLAKITPFDGSAEFQTPGVDTGLVNGDVRALVSRAGVLLSGHGIGATAQVSGRIEHYHSLRWIPDQTVTAVALDGRGDKWIGTGAGIARLSTEMTTLEARAETNEGFLQARHWRMDGFVDDRISVADEWTLEGIRTGDHDNDGLWTEMQIGAWCFAYAVTKEERFYASARKALDVMFLQVDVPGATFEAAGMKRGFITRSLVRDDEGDVFEDKATRDNWHLQAYEGREYYWKDDTSSDEYAGHYFGIPFFYDLCANDEAERQQIADYLRLTTDYLIDNDYVLIDLDGQPTLHGHWEDLAIGVDGVDPCVERHGLERAADCLSSRHGGGWLNGAEILGTLLATWHVTGDPKYFDEYERLFTDERYGRLLNVSEETFTVSKPAIANHSDHELAMLGYITLLRYEPHPERRAQYVQSLLDFYEYEREEHNPWQVAVIGAYHPGEVDSEAGLRTLQDMPLDWRTWRVDNSHRQDANRWPNDRHGDPQFDRVFPYDEIRTMKWNGSPYVVTGGSSGRGVLSPTPYLLAYWMLRYYELLDP